MIEKHRTKKLLSDYKVPNFYKKALLYSTYLIRQAMWDFQDIKKIGKPKEIKINLSPVQISNYSDNGFLHLSNIFSSDEIKHALTAIELTRNKLVGNDVNLKKFPGRMTNSHSVNKTIFDFLTDNRIISILGQILQDNPVLWGSLAFNFGTQQSTHADSPWFYTEPHNSMVGVWIALEDIHPDSGPLYYVPKSHKSIQTVENVLKKDPILCAKVYNFQKLGVSASDKKYWELSKEVEDLYVANWKNKEFNKEIICPKKGDVVIWHQNMLHGGMPRVDESLTRKSIVSHWVGLSSESFSQQKYFLNFGRFNRSLKLNLPLKTNILGKKYLRQYYSPVFDWT